MTNKGQPFNEQIEGVLNLLRSKGYMASTLTHYRSMYKKLQAFLGQSGTFTYTHEIGERFLEITRAKQSTVVTYACAIRRLNDFIDGKPFRSHYNYPSIQPPPEFTCDLDEYLQKCKADGNKSGTLQLKRRACVMFLDFLKKEGCTKLSQLNSGMVLRSLLVFSNKDLYAEIRKFLRFLSDKCVTEMDLSGIVPHFRKPKPLPTTYTPEEITRIEAAADTGTDTGKRNIAIIRLATRMGLRSGDIAKLKLTEIDFRTGYINIIQEKTGTPLSLQMPSAVSDALAAHIENDKRSSIDGYVFHQMSAPYERISTSIIRHAVDESFIAAQVDTVGKKHGPHTFRFSLASSMVNDGISYEVVRKILGHSDPNVIKRYAKADIDNLRRYSIKPPAPSGHFGEYLSGKGVVPNV